jgi:hypothetical protein
MRHTPPSFTGSLGPSSLKRPRGAFHSSSSGHPDDDKEKGAGERERSGSISGRLSQVSILYEEGVFDAHQKGVMKDMIISRNPLLEHALRKYESGDSSELKRIIES